VQTAAQSADPLDLQLLGVWHGLFDLGPASRIAAVRNHAYVYLGVAIRIYDLTDPRRPVRLGLFRSGHEDRIERMEVHGDFAFLATSSRLNEQGVLIARGGLEIYDVRDPSRPVAVGRYEGADSLYDIEIVGDHACVVGVLERNPRTLGMQILDVSEPSHPLLVSRLESGGFPRALRVVGDYAYLDVGGLPEVIDVRDPARPMRIERAKLANHASASTEVRHSIGASRTIDVAGNYAYLADETEGLAIVDVSTPLRPLSIGSYGLGGFAPRIQLVGSRAYFATAQDGFAVLDVEEPVAPVRLGQVPLSGEFQVVDNLALMAAYSGDLQVLGLNDRTDPIRIWGRDYVGPDPSDVQVVGTYAYLAAGPAGLNVIDVSHPQHPTWMGRYSTPQASKLDVEYPYAYLAAGTNGIMVVDVSQPMSPALITSHLTPGSATEIDVAGGHIYVATDRSLEVLETRPSGQVRHVGSMQGAASGVAVHGRFAYVAAGPEGLVTLDVADPSTPLRIGAFRTRQNALQVRMSAPYLYLIDGVLSFGSLRILDFSDPLAPIELLDTAEYIRFSSVDVVGNHAYLGMENPLLAVWDVSNPRKPVAVGIYRGPHGMGIPVEAVDAVGSCVYGAFQAPHGFQVLEALPLPRLQLERKGAASEITWRPQSPGFELEVSEDLKTWLRAPSGSQNPVTVPTSHRSSLFYRLSKP
jgi:hypothetical protein